MTADEARAIALSLPDVVERDHHGFPSFRTGTRGRILATLPTPEVLRVMLDEGSILEAVAEHEWCCEGRWGTQLSTVQVDLAGADPGVVAELLAEGHARARRN